MTFIDPPLSPSTHLRASAAPAPSSSRRQERRIASPGTVAALREVRIDSHVDAADRRAMSVYVVGDDEEREALMSGLALEGFRVCGFGNAVSFYRAFIAARCDMAVIDVGLDGESALSIAGNLRTHAGTGIVVLSAASSVEMRLRSFEAGADAYLLKPVDLRELSAQMRAIHRRINSATAGSSPEPRGAWALNEGGWILRDPSGRELHLTTSERALLLCLIRMRGQPVSRDEIISSLGGNPRYADPHRIDVLVNRLRQKAGAISMTLPLHSVRCKGYALAVETSSVPF
jgi:DNA-binding response OmpR family regulator